MHIMRFLNVNGRLCQHGVLMLLCQCSLCQNQGTINQGTIGLFCCYRLLFYHDWGLLCVGVLHLSNVPNMLASVVCVRWC
ncbi:hypothetical protein B0682_03810 [Moraxella lincolnii]|uniref:Uncharacterized protein n=1 Tax=Lwoffella lincolnii TaxID=90241 RepID=A0A1T0CHC1_9GAMM|nr:hypothetical protein B0682_03810 [Moraxella lincolnii]